MTRKLIALACLVVAVLAATAIWRLSPAPLSQIDQVAALNSGGETVAPTTVNERGLGSTEAGPQPRIDSAGAKIMNLDSISTVSEIELAGRQTGATRAEVLEHLQRAVAFCESADWIARHPSKLELSGQQPPEHKASRAYIIAFATKFCDSPGMNSDAINAEILQLESDGDVLQGLFLASVPESDVKAVGVPTAERLLLEAKSASTMVVAAHYLLQHRDLPQTRRLPVPLGMDRTAAQVLAVEMLACDTRGGCGPNGFHTVSNCAGICRPGITMADVWRDRNSPEAMRYARSLADALAADRRAAQAGIN